MAKCFPREAREITKTTRTQPAVFPVVSLCCDPSALWPWELESVSFSHPGPWHKELQIPNLPLPHSRTELVLPLYGNKCSCWSEKSEIQQMTVRLTEKNKHKIIFFFFGFFKIQPHIEVQHAFAIAVGFFLAVTSWRDKKERISGRSNSFYKAHWYQRKEREASGHVCPQRGSGGWKPAWFSHVLHNKG